MSTQDLEESRQKQMLRLMERYSKRIIEPNAWILPYAWKVKYVDVHMLELIETEFFCNTNNLVFAAMIFEAQMLPLQISIYSMEFNTIVR